MKISDLIDRLQEIVVIDGDLDVFINHDDRDKMEAYSIQLRLGAIAVRHEPGFANGKKVLSIDI
jgi:hypothetical protein